MLKELDAVTVAVFESLLSFIAGSKSKSSSWSFVSKLVQLKRIACEGEEVANTNELEKVDAALQYLVSHKSKKSDNTMQVEDVQIWLQDLEANIQDIEEGLECLFRRLIKTRCAREIQSIMRRRRGGKSRFTNEVRKYLASRKVVKKAVCKALGTLRTSQKKSTFSSTNNDNVTVALIGVLREVEAVSLTVFESLLSFISGAKSASKMRGWSFVSKLMLTKKVGCEEDKTEINEFADVDAALSSLVCQETSNSDSMVDSENVQSELQQLEMCSQDLEEVLECLFRRLIKNRECVQDLQSIMRRTRGGECGALTTEVRKYLTSRKMVKKAIHKAM
ncbi:unnamed protein product, partial [Prunus brigantina]